MIYEFLEANRKDIDILTSFLVTAIPIVMLYSEALGITENTIPYCILMIILGIVICEREDKNVIDELDERIQKLEDADER